MWFLQTFECQDNFISNPKEKLCEPTTFSEILKDFDYSSILENPLEAIDENFLLALIEDVQKRDIFDFSELDSIAQDNFEFQKESQSSINDFNTDLFPNEEKNLTKTIVIEGLDEFLQQISSKISFEVPIVEVAEIPVTVNDHQINFIQYESDQMVGS